MLSRLRKAELLTAVGTIMLFASTFFPWFEIPGSERLDIAPEAKLLGETSIGFELNVWDLSVARWFVYLAILSAAWMIVAALFADTARWSVILSTPSLLFGIAAAAGLVLRLVNPPAGSDVTTAYYVSVAGGLLLLAGAMWSVRDDSTPPAFDNAPEPEAVHLDSAP